MPEANDFTRCAVLEYDRLDQYKKMRAGFLERLITAFLTESGNYVTRMRSGAAELDMADVGFAAHSLKSASLNLGAARLGAMCQQIELAATTGDSDGLDRLLAGLGAAYFDAEEALRTVLMRANVAPAR